MVTHLSRRAVSTTEKVYWLAQPLALQEGTWPGCLQASPDDGQQPVRQSHRSHAALLPTYQHRNQPQPPPTPREPCPPPNMVTSPLVMRTSMVRVHAHNMFAYEDVSTYLLPGSHSTVPWPLQHPTQAPSLSDHRSVMSSHNQSRCTRHPGCLHWMCHSLRRAKNEKHKKQRCSGIRVIMERQVM